MPDRVHPRQEEPSLLDERELGEDDLDREVSTAGQSRAAAKSTSVLPSPVASSSAAESSKRVTVDGVEYEAPTEYDKYYMTLCCAGAQFCVALNQRILGPTISDLAHLMGVPLRIMVQVLATRGLGYFIGAVASGLVYAYVDKVMFIGFMLWLAAMMLILATLMPNYNVLFIIFMVQGMALGMIDPAVMTKVLDTWGKKSGPYMQLVFIGFGLGCAVTPQIARPFLFHDTMLFRSVDDESAEGDIPTPHSTHHLREDEHLDGVQRIAMALYDTRQAWLMSPGSPNREELDFLTSWDALSTIGSRHTEAEGNTLKYAYFICAAVCFAVGAMFLGFVFIRRRVKFRENVPQTVKASVIARQSVLEQKGLLAMMIPTRAKSEILRHSRAPSRQRSISAQRQQTNGNVERTFGWNKMVLLAASCLVMFHIGGHQAVVSIYIPAVASRSPYLMISKPSVAVFNTLLWFLFLAARLMSFFMSLFIRPLFVLMGCSVLLVVVGILLALLSTFGFDLGGTRTIFIGTMFGWAIGIAPFLASFLLVLRTFTMISYAEASALYSCSALADMAPFVVSFLLIYDDWTWMMPVRALAGLSGSLVVLFIFATSWGYLKVGPVGLPISRKSRAQLADPAAHTDRQA